MTQLLPQVPATVNEELVGEAGKYLHLIKTVQKDVVGFTKTRLQKWADAEFTQTLRGLDYFR